MDYQKEIKKVTNELNILVTQLYSCAQYEVKILTKKELEQKNIVKLFRTIQVQSQQSRRQKNIILNLRWRIRQLLRDKRNLLKKMMKKDGKIS